jgi:hypothetical protein
MEREMKFSEAILKGYKTNGGRQCVDALEDGAGRMCVAGAYNMATQGAPKAICDEEWSKSFQRFAAEWGIDPVVLNNNYQDRGDTNEPFPWEHIYGMARAAGI